MVAWISHWCLLRVTSWFILAVTANVSFGCVSLLLLLCVFVCMCILSSIAHWFLFYFVLSFTCFSPSQSAYHSFINTFNENCHIYVCDRSHTWWFSANWLIFSYSTNTYYREKNNWSTESNLITLFITICKINEECLSIICVHIHAHGNETISTLIAYKKRIAQNWTKKEK